MELQALMNRKPVRQGSCFCFACFSRNFWNLLIWRRWQVSIGTVHNISPLLVLVCLLIISWTRLGPYLCWHRRVKPIRQPSQASWEGVILIPETGWLNIFWHLLTTSNKHIVLIEKKKELGFLFLSIFSWN